MDWQARAQRAEAERAELRRVVVELARAGAEARSEIGAARAEATLAYREAAEAIQAATLARESLEELWRCACGGADAPAPSVGLQAEDLRAVLVRRARAPDTADRIMRLEQALSSARAGEDTWRSYARAQRVAIGEAYQAAVEGRMVDALRALMAPVDGR